MPAELEWLRPGWLLLLPLLPLLAWAAVRRARGGRWSSLVDAHLRPHLAFAADRSRRHLGLLLAIGWVVAVIALAGPSWEREVPPWYRVGTPLVVVVALDETMDRAARPERVEQVQVRLFDLLGSWTEGPVGLVVFAGSSHVASPLIDDAKALATLTGRLDAALMPRPGATAAPALALAGEMLALNGPVPGDVLLVADAIDDPAAAGGAARALHEAGHRLSVLSMDGETLAPLADAGGGNMLQLSLDGMTLAASLGEPGWWQRPPAHAAERNVGEPVDNGFWLLPLLLPLALFAFRRGLLLPLLLVVVLPPPAEAAGWWVRAERTVATALAAGAVDVDIDLLEDPAWRGVALYRAGRYAEASQAFRLAGDLESTFNRGNALAMLDQFSAAVAAYDKVLAEQPGHAAARYNRAHVARLREQQQAAAEGAEEEGGAESGDRLRDRGTERDGDSAGQNPHGPDPAPGDAEPTPQQLAEREAAEAAQELRQWLGGVPDDPGGLLRERFRREWQRSLEAAR